jgi:cytidine deaminase
VAAARAIAPTSRYRVGAAGLGASGRVYLGANLELPRAPLAQSVHAEQVRKKGKRRRRRRRRRAFV